MLHVLLAKDLKRARSNPVPYLVHLSVPLVITALLGLIFAGGGSDGDSMGKIRVAVVDEDQSPLMDFFRGSMNQGEAAKHLEPVFLPRTEALQQVTNNKVSAVLIIPTNFTRSYFLASDEISLELVKNPAEAFYPAIIEEGVRVVATGLNGVKRNFRSSLGDWQDILSGDHEPTLREVSALLERTADRIEPIKNRLLTLPVWFKKEPDEAAPRPGSIANEQVTKSAFGGDRVAAKPARKSEPSRLSTMFAFLLPGFTAMFLLLMANAAMRDLGHEINVRTFQRFCTLAANPAQFIASKVVFTVVMVLIGAVILMGGGGLVFGIHWRDPWRIALTCFSYAVFAGGFMALLAAIVSNRTADVVNNMAIMLLALASGCAFPSNALPEFMREHLMPFLPPAWFIDAVRSIHFGGAGGWVAACLKLAMVGTVLAAIAAGRFQARLKRSTLS